MKINTIQLKNFRCFESYKEQLADKFNLVVGDNGKGKSTFLDALAIGIGVIYAIKQKPCKTIQLNDVRVERFQLGQTITFEPQFPVNITFVGEFCTNPIEWSRLYTIQDNLAPKEGAEKLWELVKQIQIQTSQGESITLPVIAYYGAGRYQKDDQKIPKRPIKPREPGTRFSGYESGLTSFANEEKFFQWMMTRELESLQRGEEIGIFKAVKKAIVDCIEGATKIRYDVRLNELVLSYDNHELPFYKLSDGYRSMVAMVADIAYRMALLNPQFEDAATTETPGIVLIDEIDLHLHPKWQQHVVEDLIRTFPKVQFVATTHSPFVIQALPQSPGVRLINLDKPGNENFANKSIEDIAEELQDVEQPQRSKRFQEMVEAAEEYYRVLKEAEKASPEEIQALQNKLDQLTIPFSDNPAYVAFLNTHRLAAKIDEGNVHATN